MNGIVLGAFYGVRFDFESTVNYSPEAAILAVYCSVYLEKC